MSKINKLVIDKNVKTINPALFKVQRTQITSIDYKGTKEEFEEFKKNNEDFLNLFTALKEINFIDDKEKENIKEPAVER